MRIDFLDPAEDEFVQAIAYYNLQSEGLGYEFAAQINGERPGRQGVEKRCGLEESDIGKTWRRTHSTSVGFC